MSYGCFISCSRKRARIRENIDIWNARLYDTHIEKTEMLEQGYSQEKLEENLEGPVNYGDFFRNAPELNPNRTLIKGNVCGVRVEEIEEPLMREIRYLDKLIDELAKGKSMDKILGKGQGTYHRGDGGMQKNDAGSCHVLHLGRR